MIELSGLEVGRDIDIEFSGLRPGEKLFEELFLEGEAYQRTRHQKIFTAANGSHLRPDELEAGLSALQASAVRNDRQGILRGLQNLVPEFEPMVEKAADKPVKVVESGQEAPQDAPQGAGKDAVRVSLS